MRLIVNITPADAVRSNSASGLQVVELDTTTLTPKQRELLCFVVSDQPGGYNKASEHRADAYVCKRNLFSSGFERANIVASVSAPAAEAVVAWLQSELDYDQKRVDKEKALIDEQVAAAQAYLASDEIKAPYLGRLPDDLKEQVEKVETYRGQCDVARYLTGLSDKQVLALSWDSKTPNGTSVCRIPDNHTQATRRKHLIAGQALAEKLEKARIEELRRQVFREAVQYKDPELVAAWDQGLLAERTAMDYVDQFVDFVIYTRLGCDGVPHYDRFKEYTVHSLPADAAKKALNLPDLLAEIRGQLAEKFSSDINISVGRSEGFNRMTLWRFEDGYDHGQEDGAQPVRIGTTYVAEISINIGGVCLTRGVLLEFENE